MNKKRINILTHDETIKLLKKLAAENNNSIGDELTFIVHFVAEMGEGYRVQQKLPKEFYGVKGSAPFTRLHLAYLGAKSSGFLSNEIPGMAIVNPEDEDDSETKE